MNAFNRRAFLAGTAVAISPAALAAPSTSPDPVFAAIAAWERADAKWLAKVEEFGRAEAACHAENAFGAVRIKVELCGIPFSFGGHAEITYFLNNLPNRGPSAPGNQAQLKEAENRFRAALDAERERVEMVRSKHRIDVLEAQTETASMVATSALAAVVATVPTTLAGIRALADFMAVPDRLHGEHVEPGLASLSAACRTLLPTA